MQAKSVHCSAEPIGWWQSAWARMLRDLCQRALEPLLSVLCRPLHIEGIDNLPADGRAAILIANHSSHFDTLLLIRALPPRLRRRLAVAAAEDYFYSNPLKGAAVSLFLNALPFRRNGRALCSLRRCEKLIQNGWWLLIFPEGTRSPDGSVGMFHPGVSLLAARLGVPVIPSRLEGAHALLPKGRCWPRQTPVAIHFGKPVFCAPGEEPERASREFRAQVLALGDVASPGPAPATATARQRNKGGCYGHAA
jgi:1-acyl-sn-glycerol-3-phosphate acyltransferase